MFNDFEWPLPLLSRSRHFWCWISRKGMIYRQSFDVILIGTYTCPTQQYHFEWPWVTLSDLAKYSMTRSVVRSLSDSWASCCKLLFSLSVLSLGYSYIWICYYQPSDCDWLARPVFAAVRLLAGKNVSEMIYKSLNLLFFSFFFIWDDTRSLHTSIFGKLLKTYLFV